MWWVGGQCLGAVCKAVEQLETHARSPRPCWHRPASIVTTNGCQADMSIGAGRTGRGKQLCLARVALRSPACIHPGMHPSTRLPAGCTRRSGTLRSISPWQSRGKCFMLSSSTSWWSCCLCRWASACEFAGGWGRCRLGMAALQAVAQSWGHAQRRCCSFLGQREQQG